jgi:hypothetical protein
MGVGGEVGDFRGGKREGDINVRIWMHILRKGICVVGGVLGK